MRMDYTPPTAEQLFALECCAGITELAAHPRFAAASPDVVAAIVEGIGEFATGEWAPLNRVGDQQGAKLVDGAVCLPTGFAEAYRAYVDAGWNSIAGSEEFGGQGLPFSVACAVLENLGTANMAFTLLPMLTVGAIESLFHHGSAAQKAMYLAKLVSGEWPGTMNLTEPQAGSDVGALRTTAVPITAGEHAGKYLITGTKIYITWGDHELAENVIQLVLARTPGAPAGSRGISLFIVPKFLVGEDGSLGARNDYRAVSLEHKLGIHASPTCVMSYGDNGACIGELVGAENAGLRAMFTMMNTARINVGEQGLQLAERATQQAMYFARGRVQSPRAGSADKAPVAIIEHPDVRRMLLRMRSLTEAARAGRSWYAGRQRGAGARRRAGATAQGLGHRYRLRGDQPQHPSPRRYGLYRRDRRGTALSRCPNHPDLRGHQRDSGRRSGHAQARYGRRRCRDVIDAGYRRRFWRLSGAGRASARLCGDCGLDAEGCQP